MKKRIGAFVVAAVALTAGVAMAVDTGGRPWATIASGLGWREYGAVHKVCDHGRAVYILIEPYGDYGAISVVPNASECQFGQ